MCKLALCAEFEYAIPSIMTNPLLQGHECIKQSIAVYSLGNFLFLRGFADSKMFLERTPTEKEVKEYLDGLKSAFNPTRFSYIFRVKLTR